jgi:phenol 2-monooxygenase (NADPH)
MRFPSAQVVAQAGARAWQLHHKMPSDGRFRIVVFGGDVSTAPGRDRVNGFAAWLAAHVLARAPRFDLSPGADPHVTLKFRRDDGGTPPPSAVDVLLVHAGPRAKVDLLRDLHDVYHPFDARLGWDYDKVFSDEPSYLDGDGQAYAAYGVDRAVGALVVVRPDGYVGLVTTLEEEGWKEVGKWFEGVLRLE